MRPPQCCQNTCFQNCFLGAQTERNLLRKQTFMKKSWIYFLQASQKRFYKMSRVCAKGEAFTETKFPRLWGLNCPFYVWPPSSCQIFMIFSNTHSLQRSHADTGISSIKRVLTFTSQFSAHCSWKNIYYIQVLLLEKNVAFATKFLSVCAKNKIFWEASFLDCGGGLNCPLRVVTKLVSIFNDISNYTITSKIEFLGLLSFCFFFHTKK